MPLDRELSQRLERRRGRADADATSPAEPAVDRERYEAHIDQELKSKLRQQSELIMRQTNSGMSDSCKRPTRYEAHIDQELAKKLQKRQTELQLEGEGRPRSTKVEGLRGNSTFEAHIDNELAAKLRKRLEVEMAPQTAAPAARLEKDEVRQNPGLTGWGARQKTPRNQSQRRIAESIELPCRNICSTEALQGIDMLDLCWIAVSVPIRAMPPMPSQIQQQSGSYTRAPWE
ncbi:unnamed protein product [Durusdinium trenchii]|uniref:Uncharacterized protein n=2 Tax=Durusdinium trenchii TaxID=1381693 RepID=A0ABP0MRF9_9DINO